MTYTCLTVRAFWMQVCLVGSRQFNTFGSHGAANHVTFSYFPTLEECCQYLKDEKGDAGSASNSLPIVAPDVILVGIRGNQFQGLEEKGISSQSEVSGPQAAKLLEWRLWRAQNLYMSIPSAAQQLSCLEMR